MTAVKTSILVSLMAALTGAQSVPPRKDIPAIAKAANGAIVSIVMSDKDGHALAQGTGFLISKDGRIVTNYHVIESGSSAIVKLPDGAFFVVDGVLTSDKARDVAVIKAHGENFRTLTLGDSDRLQVGEEVVAIGNPLSLESTVSNGIVSGIRTVEEEGGKFLQVTTPISPGSSGGPLFNMAGEVVGITTLYLKGGENLNFAIPINDAKRLLLAKSSKIHDLPNEPEPVEAQTHGGDAPSSRTKPSARDYYQQLYDASAFSDPFSVYVCFSDYADSDTFFTFNAAAYDANYDKARTKVMAMAEAAGPGVVTPEMKKQFEIMQRVQRTASYVNFLPELLLKYFPPAAEQSYRTGGRFLEETIYEKGVDVGPGKKVEWLWNGSSWSLPTKTEHPDANTQISQIPYFNIEPTTMRYAQGITAKVGGGETAATDTSHYGPWTGVCEKVPKPKVK